MENLSVKVEAKGKKRNLSLIFGTPLLLRLYWELSLRKKRDYSICIFLNNKEENLTCPRLFSGRTRIYLQAVNIYLNKITEMHRKTTLGQSKQTLRQEQTKN